MFTSCNLRVWIFIEITFAYNVFFPVSSAKSRWFYALLASIESTFAGQFAFVSSLPQVARTIVPMRMRIGTLNSYSRESLSLQWPRVFETAFASRVL